MLECPRIKFRPNLANDERFHLAGITTLWGMQESNGVYDAIQERLPVWYQNGGREILD